MKYIFAVDIALRKSGLLLLDPASNILYHKILVVKPKVEYTEAMLQIYDDISETYNYIQKQYSPEHLSTVMEDVAGFVHVKAALAIHAARTAAVLAFHHSHTPHKDITYYTPNVVKHWLAGKRGAKKDELLAGLKIQFPQYNYSTLKEDEIDALALGLFHIKETT